MAKKNIGQMNRWYSIVFYYPDSDEVGLDMVQADSPKGALRKFWQSGPRPTRKDLAKIVDIFHGSVCSVAYDAGIRGDGMMSYSDCYPKKEKKHA